MARHLLVRLNLIRRGVLPPDNEKGMFMKTIRQRVISGLAGLFLVAAPHAGRAADQFIAPVDLWFFLDTGIDQGAAWRAPEFSHIDWDFGFTEFGFGDGDEFTGLNRTPNGSPLVTAYFRTRFSVDDPTIYSNITVRLLRDDGGIVYINGVEVFRSNMPTGAVSYATPAIRNIGGVEESTMAQRVVPAGVLGTINTVAVEIHQAAGDTEDMSFALQLIGHRVDENQPPSARTSFVSVEQEKATSIVLNATDPDNNPLAYTVLSSPQHGTLTGQAPNLTYTPHAGYLGSDLLSFKASDGQWETEIAYVSIEVVLPSNRPPVANAQNVLVDEDNAIALTLSANDPDGDALTYTHTLPAHGILTGTGNTLTYQAALNYHGPDSFTFTVDDGKGGTSTATVGIHVAAVNDAPVATSQNVQVSEDQVLGITLSAIDIEGDLLGYSFTQPAHGVVTGSGATVAYQPALNFYGSDSFTFTVNDGNGGIGVATVSITVTPINDLPVAFAKAAPAYAPDNFSRKLTVLALNNRDANVVLDGSTSSDVDSVLSFAWYLNGNEKPFSSQAAPVVTLPAGNHVITLSVSDGLASAQDSITVQVVTAGALVKALLATFEAAPLTQGERNSPLHYLRAACADFDAGSPAAGVQDLKLFQARTAEKVQDPAVAKYFIDEAQKIIDAVKSQGKTPNARSPRRKR